MQKFKPVFGVACLWAAALLCSALAASAGDLESTGAWIRWLPGDIPGAGYVTLVNRGAADRVLVGITSPAYGEVSLHRTADDHGVNTMLPVQSITLKPGLPVHFVAGSLHLMLMRPRSPIRPGDKVVMTLHFAAGPSVDIVFDVRAGSSG